MQKEGKMEQTKNNFLLTFLTVLFVFIGYSFGGTSECW